MSFTDGHPEKRGGIIVIPLGRPALILLAGEDLSLLGFFSYVELNRHSLR